MRSSSLPCALSCRRRSLRILGAVGSTAIAVLAGPIHAQTINWDAGAGNNLWTDPVNWAGDVLPNEFNTAVFNVNSATTVSLNGTNQKVAGLSFNQSAAYIINTGSVAGGSLTLNSISHTGNVNNQIQVPISTFDPLVDVLSVNSTSNQLQLQNRISSAGIIKTGGNNLRLGTSGTSFVNAINGNIVINAGSLTASGGLTDGSNNPLGGTGNVTIGASGVTLSLTFSNLASAANAGTYNFGRDIVANDNSFTLTVDRAAGSANGGISQAGLLTMGNATLTVNGNNGYQARLAGLKVNSGATTILGINNNSGGGQHLRLDSLQGDATTTIQKNGGQTLFISAADNTNFLGKLVLNGGTTQIEGAAGQSPTLNSGGITFLSNSSLNFRANADVDFGASISFGPGVLTQSIDANRLDTSTTGKVFGLGVVDLTGGRTLNTNGGNSYSFAFDGITIGAGTTGSLNVNSANVTSAQLTTGAGSTFNKIGGNTLTLTGSNTATSAGAINVRAGTLTTSVPGGFGTGVITVGDTTPSSSTGFPNVASRLRYGAAGASANTNGADAIAIAGGVIDLDAIPGQGDIFEVRADGRIQGDNNQLAALKIGTNLILAPDAIVLHDNPGSASPVQGIDTVAEKSIFYGVSGTATALPIVGAGTPWKGVSSDNTGRNVQTMLQVNGGDNNPSTIEVTLQGMFDQALNLGTTTTGDATFSWASTAANSEKITVAIRGTQGISTLGQVPGGRVAFNETANTSNIQNVVDKVLVQGGSLLLMTLQPLGGVPVEVLNGGSVDINNLAGNVIDGQLDVRNGGVLYLNDNQVLGGTGVVTIHQGGKLDISGSAPANIFTGSAANGQPINFTGSGHTVRFAASDIAELDSTVPNAGVTYVVAGGTTAATVAGTNISATMNTQTAGITLENGVLTNDGTTRAFSGPISVKDANGQDTNITFAASRGTDLVIASPFASTTNVNIGSLTPLDNRDKSLNSGALNWAGLPDPYNSQTRVVFANSFAAKDVTVNNTYLGFASGNTTISGDLRVNGGIVYLDGGGPISGTMGELTGKLVSGTVANRIIVGNYSRAEIKLDLASDSNATALGLNQAFVIDGDVNPLDRRSLWISRNSGTNNRVDLNNVTLNAGSVFGIQEDNTDVRVALKLAGNAISMGNSNMDYLDVSRDASLPAFDGTNPVILQQGRLNVFGAAGENVHSSNVYGTIGAGVQIDLIRGQIHLMPGATLNGVVRAQTAPAGGDAFVRSISNSTSNTFNTDTATGGTGRIELGRSAAANGPEDFEIRGTEVTNATAAQAPLHTHTGEIRIIDDGDSSTIDGIIRADRMNDSDRTARVKVDNVTIASGATVQFTSGNSIPLTIEKISLLSSSGGIDTAAGGMTINTIDGGSGAVSFSGAATPTIVNAMSAGKVNLGSSVNFSNSVTAATDVNVTAGTSTFGGTVTAAKVAVTGGNANFNANVASPVEVSRGLATLKGDVVGGLAVNVGGLANFDPGSGVTKVLSGPVNLNAGGLAIASGTLDLGNTVIAGTLAPQTVAGLREARVSGSFNETTQNTGSVVKLGPVMAQSTTGWGSNETYIYTGQFFVPDNNGDGTGSFAFAENFDDSVRVDVDGLTILRNTTWNDSVGSGVITLAAGWHDIEFRLGQGTGGAGPNANDGWNASLGLGVDLTLPIDPAAGANPNPSPTQANFVAPLDNGSMNLFRTTVSSNVNVAANSTLRAGGMSNVAEVSFAGSNAKVRLEGSGAAVASSVGALAVSGSASGTLEVVRAADSLSAGALNLAGNFVKTGAGALQMTGATTGSGNITVQQGALLLGNFASSITGSVTVEAGGNFGGTSDITGLLTLNGGKLTMTIAGLTAGTEYSRLSVLGGVSLTSNVELSLELAFNPADNGSQKFTLIENFGLGSVTDTGFFFTSGGQVLREGNIFTAGAGGFQGFKISYAGGDGNDVVLTAVPEPATAASLFGGLGLLLGMQRMRRRRK